MIPEKWVVDPHLCATVEEILTATGLADDPHNDRRLDLTGACASIAANLIAEHAGSFADAGAIVWEFKKMVTNIVAVRFQGRVVR